MERLLTPLKFINKFVTELKKTPDESDLLNPPGPPTLSESFGPRIYSEEDLVIKLALSLMVTSQLARVVRGIIEANY